MSVEISTSPLFLIISYIAKRGLLHALIDEHNADIIIGCETHLDNTYLSPEIFPTHFTIIRKDRKKGSGGVFIAFKSSIPLKEEPLLNSDAEMVWAKLCINNFKPIFLCSLYRPPNNLTVPISELRDSLNKLSDHNPGIIIVEDFNLPAIQWEEGMGCIQSSPTYGNDVNYLFIETINDSGLEQLVTEPTRNNHILDLVLTSQPDLINDVKVVPSISDHEAGVFKIKFSPTAPPSKLRKVYQYHKANTNSILEEMNHFLSTFLSQDPY